MMGRLLQFAARRSPAFTVLLAIAFLASGATGLLLPAALSATVDAAVRGDGLSGAVGDLGALLLLDSAAAVLCAWSGVTCAARTSAALQNAAVRRVLVADLRGRRQVEDGDLTSRLVTNAPEASGVLSLALTSVVSAAGSVGGLVALALIDWSLVCAFALCIPVAVLIMRVFVSRTSGLFARYQELQGTLAARLAEALTGIRNIRAGGTVDREVERVLAPLPDLSAVGRSVWRIQGNSVWKLRILLPVTEIVVLAVAGFGVADGRLSPGALIAAAGYVPLAFGFIGQVDILLGIAEACSAGRRLAAMLALPRRRAGRTSTAPDGPGSISFRDVVVLSDDGVVLDRVSVDLPGGASVAVVGRSGSGKSAFALVAGGLLDPDSGSVALDGTDLTDIDATALRREVAYAFERPVLIGATVHDAIAYGLPAATRDQVTDAARATGADHLIRRLPAGYDTPLDAAPMSGGECQRVGLARAVAGRRKLLILDDATSSLDTTTEAQVTAALATVMAGCTTIVVAHRANIAARTDLVVWLDDGGVRAVAPHHELWRERDYRAIFVEADAPESDPTRQVVA
ncbi:ABC transporter ATP-binding protein [Pseudonocardia sp. GCM10023141]|uniref:ABC transporter ATP-binding protein n=1 Tax=Pseudonocardia sp. GCM10023141 TaxID=3252653 RepID=UPI00361ECD26